MKRTEEEKKKAAERLAAAQAFLGAARELRGNPVWRALEALMAEKLREERAAHEDPRRHALRRAEHLFAVKRLEELLTWLPEEVGRRERMSRRADEVLEV